ncbi:DNA/RNA non-specific endonuclease [Apibacter raozihei]
MISSSVYQSCSSSDDGQNETDNFSISLSTVNISSIATTVKLNITTTQQWYITVDEKDRTWVSFSADQGVGNSTVNISVDANSTSESRSAIISVSNGSNDLKVRLTQEPNPGTDTGNLGWVELPERKNLTNTMFVRHSLPDNPTIRNYSMLYDTEQKVAYWVAYPMHSSYIGSSGRTDAWDFDPNISQSQQASLFKGISGYDRGHQIPSADRTSSKNNNKTTFYFSNMTPQNKDLNQKLWANLENKVRTWTYQCDTLYVVTGAMITSSTDSKINYAYDNNKNKIAIPKYYFKALLKRTKNNFTSIAYKMDNVSPTNNTNFKLYQLTVKELEDLTNFVFFPKIAEEIKNSIDENQWK